MQRHGEDSSVGAAAGERQLRAGGSYVAGLGRTVPGLSEGPGKCTGPVGRQRLLAAPW